VLCYFSSDVIPQLFQNIHVISSVRCIYNWFSDIHTSLMCQASYLARLHTKPRAG